MGIALTNEKSLGMENESGKEPLQKTLRMDETPQKTVRMDDVVQPTLRMDDSVQKTMRMDEGYEKTLRMDESQDNTFIPVGEVVTGDYITTKILTYNTGEATLYLCEKNGNKFVAKVYFENIKPKEQVMEKIRNIQSKYVIPTVEHGVHDRTNRYFEIMPFYENGDLAKQKKFTIDYLIDVIIPSVNEGLHAIHQANIVHRDIKPNNIFFGHDKSYVVLGDFGISSHLDLGTVVKTRNTNRTDGYAAPEIYNQFICKENDYYAFGIMLLELASGQHPFEGFTSEQIMKITLMESLPIPNFDPPRLTTLIKGLTLKDRNTRWGYEEVKAWLEGKDVSLVEDHLIGNTPYLFQGKKIYTLNELAETFARNWNVAKKHLYRGLVRDFVEQFGEDYELKVIECEENRNQDLGLFEFITFIHSNPPLFWKGRIYKDLGNLADVMKKKFPEINKNIQDLLVKGILLSYLKKLKINESNLELYKEIKKITNLAKSNSTLAYYRLAFILNGSAEFHYQNNVFHNMESLITFFHENQMNFHQYAQELINNQYFHAWLIELGYENHLEKWRSILNN